LSNWERRTLMISAQSLTRKTVSRI
jgi:hypothetical protein